MQKASRIVEDSRVDYLQFAHTRRILRFTNDRRVVLCVVHDGIRLGSAALRMESVVNALERVVKFLILVVPVLGVLKTRWMFFKILSSSV